MSDHGGTQSDPERLRIEQRRAKAIHLKTVVGLTWEQVAEQCGYNDKAHAFNDISRALKQQARANKKSLEELVEQQDIRLDAMRQRTYAIMVAPAYVIQGGKFVLDSDGNKVRDNGPALAALSTLLRIEERWSNLHGTDASKKLEIALERRTDVESNLVTEAILAAAEALTLPPADRMRMLEAAAARLEVVDAEIVEGS
jgi:hypothetical protein